VSDDACDPWQFELTGGGFVTSPDGDEISLCARLVWTMTQEHSLRFLIYVNGEEVPSVRVVSPGNRNVIAAATIAAFADLIGLVT
jgi:hypothetical protein